jgi:prephenate dehydrogenase
MAGNTIQIGILGMGRLGTSIGLAIRRFAARKETRQQFQVSGYDTDAARAKAARERGALDAVVSSPAECADGRDIVVIALPLGEVAGGLRAIAPALRDSAVILDFSPYKAIGATWAQSAPDRRAHLLGVTALFNPDHLFDGIDDPEHAAGDLFDRGHLLIAGAPDAEPAALELAADFAALLGAAPQFIDPAEHDVWMTWMTALPTALGIGAFLALRQSPGWDGIRRAGNAEFGRLTGALAGTQQDDLQLLLSTDRAGLTRALDAAIEALTVLRDLAAREDPAGLREAVARASEEYQDWLTRRRRGEWDPTEANLSMAEITARTSLLGGLLGRRSKNP